MNVTVVGRQPRIIDGRNLYDPALMPVLGTTYKAIGRAAMAAANAWTELLARVRADLYKRFDASLAILPQAKPSQRIDEPACGFRVRVRPVDGLPVPLAHP